MMRLYLAGPMSGHADLNYPLFNSEAARLRTLGYEVMNPAEIGTIEGYGWADYMRICIGKLLTCEWIALLPGWIDSPGARHEHHISQWLGMPSMLASEIQAGPAA